MNTNDIIFLESARKKVYKGLAACFNLPDTHLVAVLEDLAHQLTILESEASVRVARMATFIRKITDFTELKIEFSRLFVGPYRQLAPPYGSVYLEKSRTMMSDSTLDALAAYRAAGLMVADTYKEAPDHIAVELEFVGFLVFKEIEALQSDSGEVPQSLLFQQKEFLSRHMSLWVGIFSQNIADHSTSPFYQNLANTLTSVIKEEMDYLNTPGLCDQVVLK